MSAPQSVRSASAIQQTLPANAAANKDNASWLDKIKEVFWNAVKCLLFCVTWDNDEAPTPRVTSAHPPVKALSNTPRANPSNPPTLSSSTDRQRVAELENRVAALARENGVLKNENTQILQQLNNLPQVKDQEVLEDMARHLEDMATVTREQIEASLPGGVTLDDIAEIMRRSGQLQQENSSLNESFKERDSDAKRYEIILDNLPKVKNCAINTVEKAKVFTEDYDKMTAKFNSLKDQANSSSGEIAAKNMEMAERLKTATRDLRNQGALISKFKGIADKVLGVQEDLNESVLSQLSAKIHGLTEAAKSKEIAENQKKRMKELEAQIKQLNDTVSDNEKKVQDARKEIPEDAKNRLSKLTSDINLITQNNEANELRVKQLEESLAQSAEREREALSSSNNSNENLKKINKLSDQVRSLEEKLGKEKADHAEEVQKIQGAHQAELKKALEKQAADSNVENQVAEIERLVEKLKVFIPEFVLDLIYDESACNHVVKHDKFEKVKVSFANKLTELYRARMKEAEKASKKEAKETAKSRSSRSGSNAKQTLGLKEDEAKPELSQG